MQTHLARSTTSAWTGGILCHNQTARSQQKTMASPSSVIVTRLIWHAPRAFGCSCWDESLCSTADIFPHLRLCNHPETVRTGFNRLRWCGPWLENRCPEPSRIMPGLNREIGIAVWIEGIVWKPLLTFSVFYHLGDVDVFHHDRPAFSVVSSL